MMSLSAASPYVKSIFPCQILSFEDPSETAVSPGDAAGAPEAPAAI